jgi:hypothetical protein
MKNRDSLRNESIIRRLYDGQRGQSIVLIMISLVALLGMTAIVVDIGRLYYAYQQLVTSTQAAALAGGAVMTDPKADPVKTATSYSSVKGNLNAYSNLSNVTLVAGYPKLKCLQTLANAGLPCSAFPSGSNAIAVQQTTTVPTTFAGVLGFKSWPLTATATAAAKGGFNGPYNVIFIVDTTGSMNGDDNNCGSTRISCALSGLQTLLKALSPCPAGGSCGSSTALDNAGLMVFPGLTSTAEAAKDYTCPTQAPKTASYNNVATQPTSPYQIVALTNDYRTSNTSALNTSSHLVIAAGGGCSKGIGAPGGQGTFYAGVIDAAQAQLVASTRPNTKNVMILLSDGDAGASPSQMAGSTTKYPTTQQCHQAITSAQNAAAATPNGTIVYAVAYGASASSGCSTDTSPSITPCKALQQIASSPGTPANPLNFFSDNTASGGDKNCTSIRPTSNLNQIFTQIAGDLTVARLIPNNTN